MGTFNTTQPFLAYIKGAPEVKVLDYSVSVNGGDGASYSDRGSSRPSGRALMEVLEDIKRHIAITINEVKSFEASINLRLKFFWQRSRNQGIYVFNDSTVAENFLQALIRVQNGEADLNKVLNDYQTYLSQPQSDHDAYAERHTRGLATVLGDYLKAFGSAIKTFFHCLGQLLGLAGKKNAANEVTSGTTAVITKNGIPVNPDGMRAVGANLADPEQKQEQEQKQKQNSVVATVAADSAVERPPVIHRI